LLKIRDLARELAFHRRTGEFLRATVEFPRGMVDVHGVVEEFLRPTVEFPRRTEEFHGVAGEFPRAVGEFHGRKGDVLHGTVTA
jgi:hypothetical protein